MATIQMSKSAGSSGASPTPSHRAKRRPSWRPKRPLALLIALGFFFGPAGAFLLGVRPVAFENRALADLPSLAEGWQFFPDFTTWSVDHLPLRDKAVSANAALTERLFGEAPSYRTDTGDGPTAGVPASKDPASDAPAVEYPRVIEGEDGWLYFGGDVSNLCVPVHSVADTMDRLDRLARMVEDSGRRFVLTVAPDKASIFPDRLPETFLGSGCTAERRGQFWDAIRANPPAGYVDLRDPLLAEQERTGEPIYRQTDTHWAPRGAGIYVTELARALDPSLLDTTKIVESGEISREGDLGKMIGRPNVDRFAGVGVERPGVVPTGRESLELPAMSLTTPVRSTNRTTGAPLFQPRTLLLGDSFSNSSRGLLGPLFADISVLHNEVASSSPQISADAMADADVVIYEIVERTIASGRGALIEDRTLDAIEKTLAAHPR
ncbi:MAG: hypothetical protein JWQ99_1933 [Blastococcus sp.]|nr:hypothetical protein [Blastococcus sp.]